MKRKFVMTIALCAMSAWSQRVTDRKTADIRGGGGDGKCTIEVVVDDIAEVEIMGSNATIRTLSGSPATFRRFECNQQMPMRPNDFSFKGIDGRGRQDMVRSASDGGRAVIRIEDSKGGSEGYTFDIFWRGGSGGSGSVFGNDRGGFNDRGNNGRGNGRGGYDDRGGYGNGNGNGGWNNGWGDGNGWVTNGNFNYDSGRNGRGSYRDRNGRNQRLDGARVSISNNGSVSVDFQGDRRLELSGRVVRRQGRRVFADVRGGGMFGTLEIEMSNNSTVNRISLPAVDLNWSN